MRQQFDLASSNLIVINYPPGGFGNFLHHVLTEFANETVKVNNKFEFSKSGNSHATQKYTQIYYHNPVAYYPFIDSSVDSSGKRILVLCDNGLDTPELDKVIETFPNAQIIRVVPDGASKYLLSQTCTEKASAKIVEDLSYEPLIAIWDKSVLGPSIDKWTSIDHKNVRNLSLTNLVLDPVNTISELFTALGLSPTNKQELELFCNDWLQQNSRYISTFKEYYDRTVVG